MSVDSEAPSFVSRWAKRKQRANVNTASEPSDAAGLKPSEPDQTALDAGFSTSNISSPLRADSDAAETVATPPVSDSEVEASTELDVSNDALAESDEPVLCDEDMPPVESLTAGSDVSIFFNKGVSEVLRRAALKHIFQLPQYNVRDGLNDYDEDYTVFEPLGDTVTCDMKFHKERKEKLLAEEQARLEELEEQARLEQQDALDEQESQQELSDDEAQQSAEDDQDEITLAESEADSEPAGPHVESDAALLNPEDGLVDVSPLENLSFDNASVESPDVHDQLAQECQDGEPCETTNQADETGHKKTRVLPPS